MPTPAPEHVVNNPSALCPGCSRLVDLADARVVVIPTLTAGYAFCPECGELVPLDGDTTRRARKARGVTAIDPGEDDRSTS